MRRKGKSGNFEYVFHLYRKISQYFLFPSLVNKISRLSFGEKSFFTLVLVREIFLSFSSKIKKTSNDFSLHVFVTFFSCHIIVIRILSTLKLCDFLFASPLNLKSGLEGKMFSTMHVVSNGMGIFRLFDYGETFFLKQINQQFYRKLCMLTLSKPEKRIFSAFIILFHPPINTFSLEFNTKSIN